VFDLRANNDFQKLEINQLPKKEADIIREELVCFHSRRHFTEDVLGIDISLIWNNRCENLTAVTVTIATTTTTVVTIAALLIPMSERLGAMRTSKMQEERTVGDQHQPRPTVLHGLLRG
jgi:hypothetical protein